MKNKFMEKAMVITVMIALFVALYSIIQNHAEHNEWVESRQVETIRVAPNETLWAIAEQNKPDFMDVREYIYEIKELNNMENSDLYVGDELYIYVY